MFAHRNWLFSLYENTCISPLCSVSKQLPGMQQDQLTNLAYPARPGRRPVAQDLVPPFWVLSEPAISGRNVQTGLRIYYIRTITTTEALRPLWMNSKGQTKCSCIN